MSGSLNKVCLIGNLGRDPEMRSTQDGKRIANLTVATSDSWKDRQTGDRKEKTEWHKIAVFNDALCGVIESYLRKGSKVYLEGQLQTRKWVDKDGAERYSTEVVLQGFDSKLVLLDKAERNESLPNQSGGYSSAKPADSLLDEEIPF